MNRKNRNEKRIIIPFILIMAISPLLNAYRPGLGQVLEALYLIILSMVYIVRCKRWDVKVEKLLLFSIWGFAAFLFFAAWMVMKYGL